MEAALLIQVFWMSKSCFSVHSGVRVWSRSGSESECHLVKEATKVFVYISLPLLVIEIPEQFSNICELLANFVFLNIKGRSGTLPDTSVLWPLDWIRICNGFLRIWIPDLRISTGTGSCQIQIRYSVNKAFSFTLHFTLPLGTKQAILNYAAFSRCMLPVTKKVTFKCK